MKDTDRTKHHNANDEGTRTAGFPSFLSLSTLLIAGTDFVGRHGFAFRMDSPFSYTMPSSLKDRGCFFLIYCLVPRAVGLGPSFIGHGMGEPLE